MHVLAFAPRERLLARIEELEQQVAAMLEVEDEEDDLPGVLPEAHLRPVERRIFTVLLRERGHIVPVANLTAAIHPSHGGEHVDPKCLRVHVCRLRQKVDPAAVCIRTVHGRGYIVDREASA